MNKIIQLLRDGMMQKLIIARGDSPVIPAGATVDFDIDIQVNKLLLKSIEIRSDKNQDFRVEFFEDINRNNSRYNSGKVTLECYDVLDLPFWDERNVHKMYLRITNLGVSESTYHAEVRGLELK